jgi:GNAT superfamily N-acetyltransferase
MLELLFKEGDSMEIRLARQEDIVSLIRMRWDFTLEHDTSGKVKEEDYAYFNDECREFLMNAIGGNDWYIWVAELDEKIVSHIFIELVHKVPRPGRITYPFAYMTNVYTLPDYRGKGIGSKLLTRINEWAKEQKYEFVIVWPSDESIEFYRRNGYRHCKEPMESMF